MFATALNFWVSDLCDDRFPVQVHWTAAKHDRIREEVHPDSRKMEKTELNVPLDYLFHHEPKATQPYMGLGLYLHKAKFLSRAGMCGMTGIFKVLMLSICHSGCVSSAHIAPRS